MRVWCSNVRTMFSVGKTAQIVKEARRYTNKKRECLGSHGERQRLRQETGQLGGGGSMAPLSTRRGGIGDC